MVWVKQGAEILCGGYQADGLRLDFQASAPHPDGHRPHVAPVQSPHYESQLSCRPSDQSLQEEDRLLALYRPLRYELIIGDVLTAWSPGVRLGVGLASFLSCPSGSVH